MRRKRRHVTRCERAGKMGGRGRGTGVERCDRGGGGVGLRGGEVAGTAGTLPAGGRKARLRESVRHVQASQVRSAGGVRVTQRANRLPNITHTRVHATRRRRVTRAGSASTGGARGVAGRVGVGRLISPPLPRGKRGVQCSCAFIRSRRLSTICAVRYDYAARHRCPRY